MFFALAGSVVPGPGSCVSISPLVGREAEIIPRVDLYVQETAKDHSGQIYCWDLHLFCLLGL